MNKCCLLLPLFSSFLILFFSSSSINAQETYHNLLSFQGFTGTLNTPNAFIADEGTINMVYSDQLEPKWRNDKNEGEDNYIVSIGLFSFLEISGRLTDVYPTGSLDLSANVKFQLPIKHKYLPQLAVGITDVSGGSQHLKSKYVVLSKNFNPFSFSFGYGQGLERLNGKFGGMELKIHKWIYLLSEDDTVEKNFGIRLFIPNILFHTSIGFTAKTSLENIDKPPEFSFLLQVPLGGKKISKKILKQKDSFISLPESAKPGILKLEEKHHLYKLEKTLVNFGLEEISIGLKNTDTIVIEYENNRYNHSELDALGLVLGCAARMSPDTIEFIEIVVKNRNIQIINIKTSVRKYKNFLYSSKNKQFDKNSKLLNIENISPYKNISKIRYISKNNNSSKYKLRLTIFPGLKTFVGTDFGTFDYLLSLKPDLSMIIWKGATINALWDIPLDWSINFNKNEIVDIYREKTQMERLMINQAFKISSGIMTMFNVGNYLKTVDALLNETMWNSPSGKHRIRTRSGIYKLETNKSRRKTFLSSYRYNFAAKDISLELTYGKYWGQDLGFRMEIKRNFEDSNVVLFYKDTYKKPNKKSRQRAIGLAVSFPLTPKRDMKPSYIQVKGINRWSYGLQTTFARQGERNTLNTNLALIPSTTYNIEHVYYNNDRLNSLYIKNNMHRLRNSYINWIQDK